MRSQTPSEPQSLPLQDHIAKLDRSIRDQAIANQHFVDGTATDTGYTGSAHFAALVVYEEVGVKMPVGDHTYGFSGKAWGIGIGGGVSAGGGKIYIPLEDLPGPAEFTFAVGFASTVVTMTRNDKVIATFVGAGLNVGAATGGGSGEIVISS
jgi:hypothetical protein